MLTCQYKAFGLILLIVLGYLFVLFEVQSLQADVLIQSPRAWTKRSSNLRKKIPILQSLSGGTIDQFTRSKNHSMSIPGLIYGTAWKKEQTKVSSYGAWTYNVILDYSISLQL